MNDKEAKEMVSNKLNIALMKTVKPLVVDLGSGVITMPVETSV